MTVPNMEMRWSMTNEKNVKRVSCIHLHDEDEE